MRLLDARLHDDPDGPDAHVLRLERASALAAAGRYAESAAELVALDDQLEVLDYSSAPVSELSALVFATDPRAVPRLAPRARAAQHAEPAQLPRAGRLGRRCRGGPPRPRAAAPERPAGRPPLRQSADLGARGHRPAARAAPPPRRRTPSAPRRPAIREEAASSRSRPASPPPCPATWRPRRGPTRPACSSSCRTARRPCAWRPPTACSSRRACTCCRSRDSCRVRRASRAPSCSSTGTRWARRRCCWTWRRRRARSTTASSPGSSPPRRWRRRRACWSARQSGRASRPRADTTRSRTRRPGRWPACPGSTPGRAQRARAYLSLLLACWPA